MGDERSVQARIVKIAFSGLRGRMRVPDTGLRSIVYLGYGSPFDPFRAIGTGFLIKHQREQRNFPVYYLVTADHVARKLEKMKPVFSVRLNDENGIAHGLFAPTAPKWWRHPTDKTVDAAVFPWRLSPKKYPFTVFPTEKFVTRQNIKKTLIGIGDEIYILGLFRKWAGKDRITPLVRHGHIAMMATEQIETKNYGKAYFHLIDAMTTAGLSGSPVFVEETVSAPLQGNEPDDPPYLYGLGETYLLGLVHGFMPVKVAEEIMGASPNQLWHSGICQVVPSIQILDILDQPELIEYEKKVMGITEKTNENESVESSVNEPTDYKPKGTNRDIEIPPVKRKKFFKDLEKVTKKTR
jgi:hypothetical protein